VGEMINKMSEIKRELVGIERLRMTEAEMLVAISVILLISE